MVYDGSILDPYDVKLVIDRNVFREQIKMRIDQGSQLTTKVEANMDAFEIYQDEFDLWDEGNLELIMSGFNQKFCVHVDRYKTLNLELFKPSKYDDLDYQSASIKYLLDKINRTKFYLTKLHSKLEFIQEVNPSINNPKAIVDKGTPTKNKCFLVHGHDDKLKYEVARYIEKQLMKETVILHEQPSSSKTLIEKLEANCDVDFAVCLWTTDDTGKAKNEEFYNGRARQNVIYETGYFHGLLGRGNVIVLYQNGVEINTDYLGVCYIKLSEDWKAELKREVEEIYNRK